MLYQIGSQISDKTETYKYRLFTFPRHLFLDQNFIKWNERLFCSTQKIIRLSPHYTSISLDNIGLLQFYSLCRKNDLKPAKNL